MKKVNLDTWGFIEVLKSLGMVVKCSEKRGQVKGESQGTTSTWNEHSCGRGDAEQDNEPEGKAAPTPSLLFPGA